MNQVNQVNVNQQQQQMHPNQRMNFAAQHPQQFVPSMQTNLNMQANVQSKLQPQNTRGTTLNGNGGGKAPMVRNANHKKSGERSAAVSKYNMGMRRTSKS